MNQDYYHELLTDETDYYLAYQEALEELESSKKWVDKCNNRYQQARQKVINYQRQNGLNRTPNQEDS